MWGWLAGECVVRRQLLRVAPLWFALLTLTSCVFDSQPGPYEAMLRLVPREPGPTELVMGDVARYRELAGIELADREIGAAEYLALLDSAAERVPFFLGVGFITHPHDPGLPELADMARRSLGFGLADVDQWLMSKTNDEPMRRFALRGSFAPDRADELLVACDACPPAERAEYRGTNTYAWGGDHELGAGAAQSPPIFDNLGRGCCLAIQSQWVLRAYSRAGLRSMLDAQAGESSLADDEDFRLAAEGLDALAPVHAFVTDDPPDRADAEGFAEAPDSMRAADKPAYRRTWAGWIESADAELLRRYVVLAYGPGYSPSDGNYLAVVLVHDCVEAARENSDRLPRRVAAVVAEESPSGSRETWGDRFDRVEVDGRVVRARLWSDRSYLPFDLSLHALFIHE